MSSSKKNIFAGYLFSSLLFCGCGQTQSVAVNQHGDSSQNIVSMEVDTRIDSIAIMQAFEKLKMDKNFLKDLALQDENQFSWNDDLHTIIHGDLDGDGTSDALLGFIIEDRGGGNNSDGHYAVFLNQNKEWKYQTQLDAGGNWAERLIQLDEIKNRKITGRQIGNKDESLPEVPIEYVLKNGQLMNTETTLHKTKNEEREYLHIENIITPTSKLMPLTGTLEEYERILGNGRIVTPKEQPDCGTYFDEGIYSEMYYGHRMMIELQNKEKAAWRSVFIRGSNYKINTDKGTITENTTLEELKNIFHKKGSWQIVAGENGGKIFSIPDGPESDNQLQIIFSKDGKVEGIYLSVSC